MIKIVYFLLMTTVYALNSVGFQRLMQRRSLKQLFVRPTLDDVERISKGQAAKRRGTGSRSVPHRLNALERKEWDLAKVRRFLMLRGTGYRKERGDSPLANIYRNYCDALGVPCISIIRSLGRGELIDQVIVDFSPLRNVEQSKNMTVDCMNLAKNFTSAIHIDDFTSLPGYDSPVLESVFRDNVIWQLPVIAVQVQFQVRSDAKLYAQQLAMTYAGGTEYRKVLVDDDIDEENEDL
jgi:hypothetical protein